MAEDSKIHTGHRRRMRSRVAENGFASLEPHEALECLLYITNARKNTNRMAHELIDRFGDFAGVLDASEEDLMTVEGVGPATAKLLWEHFSSIADMKAAAEEDIARLPGIGRKRAGKIWASLREL